jgi:ATP-dependent Lhr-like helicase
MHGASFLAEMRTGTGLSLAALQNALAELFWNGMITNDLFSEILLLKRSGRIGQTVPLELVRPIIRPHSPEARRVLANARRAIRTASGSHGRWALVRTPAIEGVPLEAEERAEEHAVRLLHRHGILAREFVSREDLLPWQVIAPVLQRMEMRGEIRRGYFVEGLSGMQFALPEAAEGLERSLAPGADAQEPLLLTMVDPAVPFGPGIPLPGVVQDDAALRVARIPSSCIAFARGEPVAFCEGWGSKITLLGDGGPEQCRMVVAALAGLLRLPASMRPFTSLTIEYINGQRPAGTAYEGVLRALGLRREMNQTLRLD